MMMLTRKTIIGLTAILVLPLLAITIYSWGDTNYAYLQDMYVNNTGSGAVTNLTFLVNGSAGVDTASLITGGKMQADCDDMRFYDADDSTQLDCHMLNSTSATHGCNTANTLIACRNPSATATGEVDYFYYDNSSVSSSWNQFGSYDESWKMWLHFEDEAGTTPQDVTPNNLDGSFVNNAAYTSSGILGYGVALDGNADSVDLGDNFDGFTSATWFACFKLAGQPDSSTARVWTDEDAFNMEINSDKYFHCAVNTGTWAAINIETPPIVLNKEYCGACKYNGSHLTAYLYNDSTLYQAQVAKTGTAGDSTHKTWLGCSDPSTPGTCDRFEFQGTIDEAAFYSGNLTDNEIKQLAQLVLDGDMSALQAEEAQSPPAGGPVNEFTITLNSPGDGTSNTSGNIQFAFTVDQQNVSLANCSVWGNWTGTWADNTTNTTTVNNNSATYITINGIPTGIGHIWNVECYNDTVAQFASANYTLDIDTGQPYAISYAHVNLTTLPAEDGIYSGSAYGDVDNDQYAEFIWSPVTEDTGDNRYVYITENGVTTLAWDNGTNANFVDFSFPVIFDRDNDGDNDVMFGATDNDGGGFLFMEFNSSGDDVYTATYWPFQDAQGDNNKPEVYDDWNGDGYTDFMIGTCSAGEIQECHTSDGSAWSCTQVTNADATVEDMIQYDVNTTTSVDEVYYMKGFVSETTTSNKVVYAQVDSNIDFWEQTTVLTVTSSMPTFCGNPEDADGDGNDELCIAWMNDVTNTYNITCYEMAANGALTQDFVVGTVSSIDHSQWGCEMSDHDLDGDVEIFAALRNADQVTKYFYMYECPGGTCTRTDFFEGVEHTEDSSDAGQAARWYDHPKGQMFFGGFLDDPIIWGVNYTLPQWRNGGQLRVEANDTDDIYLSAWCYDTGGNTALTYYLDFYKNDTLQSALSVSGTFVNGTEINHTITSGNLTDGDVWKARLTCDDGFQNSTTHNSTDIEITGIPADTTPPSVTIDNPDNITYTSTPIDINITAGEASITCQYMLDSGANTTLSNDSATNWYGLISSISEKTQQLEVYCNDSAGNWGYSSVWLTYDVTAPTMTLASPLNVTYGSSPINLNVTTSEASSTCIYNLDEGSNSTLSNDSTTNWYIEITGMSEATHQVNVYCNDTAGNMNINNSIWFTYDVTSPTITIASPLNQTYSSQFNLNVTVGESASTCLYNFDGGSNTTLSNDSTTNWYIEVTPASDGTKQLNVYCNDSIGNMALNDTIWLTWDTTAPTIAITSPTNTSYSSYPININVTTGESASACLYSLDSGTNYTLSNSSTTNWYTENQTAIANGTTVQLYVYCNDTLGNLGLNSTIWFTYDVQAPSTFTCNSCSECSEYLQNGTLSAGYTLQLTANITEDNSSCIEFGNAAGITFDCQGKTVSGDGDGDGYGIYMNSSSQNNTVRNCANVSYFQYGIYIQDDNNTVYNCTSLRNYDNIRLSSAENCNISYSASSNGGNYGITIYSSNSNDLISDTITSSGIDGLYLYGASNNTFSTVTATSDSQYGIRLNYNSDGNFFTGISSTSSGSAGLVMQNSDYNVFNDSVISSMTFATASGQTLDYNSFYNNNITGTITRTGTEAPVGNSLNTTESVATNIVGGPNKGGNCWGTGCSAAGFDSDGNFISDTSYSPISGTMGTDYLPLITSDFTTTVTTAESDYNWSFSDVPAGEELMNINFSYSGNQNNTIYFTLNEDLANTTLVSVNSTTNLTLTTTGTTWNTFNLSINSSALTGTYSGNLTWISANDSGQTGNITIYFGIAALAGNVNITTTSWSASKSTTGTYVLTLSANNTGTYNLSHCNWTFTSALGATAAFSNSDFTITNTTSYLSSTATISGGSEGTDTTARFTLTCQATAAGDTDTDSLTGTLTLTAPSSTGGGGGPVGPGVSCGYYNAYPTGAFEGYNQPGHNMSIWYLRIDNGNVSQTFYADLSDEVSPYCDILDGPTDETPAYGFAMFSIMCRAPEEKITGHLLLTTDTGCEDSRPIIIYPSSAIISEITEGIYNFATGKDVTFWAVVVLILLALAAVGIWLIGR